MVLLGNAGDGVWAEAWPARPRAMKARGIAVNAVAALILAMASRRVPWVGCCMVVSPACGWNGRPVLCGLMGLSAYRLMGLSACKAPGAQPGVKRWRMSSAVARGRPSACADTTAWRTRAALSGAVWPSLDRKSTRLNSSHLVISYAVFCL